MLIRYLYNLLDKRSTQIFFHNWIILIILELYYLYMQDTDNLQDSQIFCLILWFVSFMIIWRTMFWITVKYTLSILPFLKYVLVLHLRNQSLILRFLSNCTTDILSQKFFGPENPMNYRCLLPSLASIF